MRKFILTDSGELRLGDVDMHKELLRPGEVCYGGGMYEFDYVGNRLLLDGRSFDYGRPKWFKVDALWVARVYEGLTVCWEGEPVEQWIAVKYFD